MRTTSPPSSRPRRRSRPSPAEPVSGPLEDLAYWADGYILLGDKTAASTTANPTYSFNRSGGAITTTRVAGTTGRYIVTFRGLSAALGSKSSVHVSPVGADPSYCKPVGGTLVSDKVEVRCYKVGTGVPINSLFTLMVIGKTDARAFAFANQPTATDYAPAGAGSWNPTGATRVFREGLGRYRVVFKGLGARFPTNGGHVQVNATGTGKTHCKSVEQGTLPDFQVLVWCFTPAGAPADAKFTVVVTPPAAHLAYALANVPAAASYTPDPTYSWNPVGGAVSCHPLRHRRLLHQVDGHRGGDPRRRRRAGDGLQPTRRAVHRAGLAGGWCLDQVPRLERAAGGCAVQRDDALVAAVRIGRRRERALGRAPFSTTVRGSIRRRTTHRG